MLPCAPSGPKPEAFPPPKGQTLWLSAPASAAGAAGGQIVGAGTASFKIDLFNSLPSVMAGSVKRGEKSLRIDALVWQKIWKVGTGTMNPAGALTQ